MNTGYNKNQGGRELEQAQMKRAQDAVVAKKKRDLATQIAAIKNFIFSTKTMIDAKTPILRQKESKEKEIKVSIMGIQAKEQSIQAQIQRAKEALEKIQKELDKLKLEEEKKKKDLGVVEHEDAELKRQITQLTTDKTKLEANLKKAEIEMMQIR